MTPPFVYNTKTVDIHQSFYLTNVFLFLTPVVNQHQGLIVVRDKHHDLWHDCYSYESFITHILLMITI